MTTEAVPRTRVLVVGGWGRCGSTLLDMLLGQVDGFVSAGEVRELWLRGCVEDRPCGCGDPFSRCVFWSQVGKEAFGGWDRVDLETILRARYRWDRPWGLPRLLGPSDRGDGTDLATYTQALARLMTAIATVSGASVIVDSSKIPTHTLLLMRSRELDVRMVHLVRDSRGVAYSNQKHVVKRVTTGEPTLLPRYSAVRSGVRYDLYNAANGALRARLGDRWRRLRYEDLVADPAARLADLARHAGANATPDLSFVDGRHVTLGTNHLVDGNPVRFARELSLHVDDEWQQLLSGRDRRIMSVLTWPLLRRYAYPVRRR